HPGVRRVTIESRRATALALASRRTSRGAPQGRLQGGGQGPAGGDRTHGYCAAGERPRGLMAPTPWYTLILIGTNDRDQPVCVAMDFRLPSNPPGPQIAPAPVIASPLPPGPALVSQPASGSVPFQTIYNHIWLHAVPNHK